MFFFNIYKTQKLTASRSYSLFSIIDIFRPKLAINKPNVPTSNFKEVYFNFKTPLRIKKYMTFYL